MMRPWPPEATELLRALWNDQDLTASECAAALNAVGFGPLTKNAVIGKVHREKMTERDRPLLLRARRRRRAARRGDREAAGAIASATADKPPR